ncbi:MAG: tandem-95 repeat protein [Fuerstiella sp.]|nr:tandem-95 repeat protein [Fuerstiella sp.]
MKSSANVDRKCGGTMVVGTLNETKQVQLSAKMGFLNGLMDQWPLEAGFRVDGIFVPRTISVSRAGTSHEVAIAEIDQYLTLDAGIHSIEVVVRNPFGESNSFRFKDTFAGAVGGSYSHLADPDSFLRIVEFNDHIVSGLVDNGRSVITQPENMSGIVVHREITVPDSGSLDFARWVDVFHNPTDSTINTTVSLLGNLGSDANTTIVATSDGDTTIDTDDFWFATADPIGGPVIVHLFRNEYGVQPSMAGVVAGDNTQIVYPLSVEPGETIRLAHFTVIGDDLATATAAANVLLGATSFGGEGAAFLNQDELASIANFAFNTPPVADAGGPYVVNEGSQRIFDGSATFDREDANSSLTFEWDLNYDGVTFDVDQMGEQPVVTFADDFPQRTIALRVTDPLDDNDLVTTTLLVNNNAPVANDDSVSTDEDSPTTVTVLTNDSDVDADPLTIAGYAGPANGSIAINAGGTITYTPNANFHGIDSFTYSVSDGDGAMDTATVTVSVISVNDPPLASDDSVAVGEDDGATDLTLTLLSNDVDGDDIPRAVITFDDLGLEDIQSVGLSPFDIGFGYTMQRSSIASGTSGHIIFAEPGGAQGGNAGGVAGYRYLSTHNPDQILTHTFTRPDGNAFDLESLRFHGWNNNAAATLIVDAVTSSGLSVSQSFAIINTFTAPFQTAVFSDDFNNVVSVVFRSPAAQAGVFQIDDITVDAAAASRDVLSVSAIDTTGTVGAVTLVAGIVSYDPNGQFETLAAGQTAVDRFSYTVDDGNGGTDTAVVTVTVTGVNDVPTVAANNAAVVANEGSSAINSGAFSDVDLSDNVTVTASIGTVNQSGTQNGTWGWSFDAINDLSQDVVITANDGQGGVATTTFELTVKNVAPVVTLGGRGVYEGNPLRDVFFATPPFFTDPGTDQWTATVDFGDGRSESLTLNADKTFLPDHVYADDGTFTLTVTVDDGDGGVGTASAPIVVFSQRPELSVSVDQTVDEGSVLSLVDLGMVSDLGFDDPIVGTFESFTYSVNWGDGTAAESGPVTIDHVGSAGNDRTLGSFDGSHVYQDEGTYTVTATVIDDDGAVSDPKTFQVTANNVAPVLNPLVLSSAQIGENGDVTVSGTFTDPGAIDRHKVAISWGDSSATTVFTLNTGDRSFTATHRYLDNHPSGVSGPLTRSACPSRMQTRAKMWHLQRFWSTTSLLSLLLWC